MALDVEKYLPYLDEYDWARDEKVEMLRSLWRMMEAQADKAFGLNSLQLSCGQLHQSSLRNQQSSVDSKDQSISKSYGEAANNNFHKAMSSKGDQKYAK